MMRLTRNSIWPLQVEDTTMDGREVVSKFSQEVPNQLEEEQVRRYTRIEVHKYKNSQVTKFYVSNSILLFDADFAFP